MLSNWAYSFHRPLKSLLFPIEVQAVYTEQENS